METMQQYWPYVAIGIVLLFGIIALMKVIKWALKGDEKTTKDTASEADDKTKDTDPPADKAAKEADFKKRVELRRLSMQRSAQIRGWCWWLGLLGLSVWAIWFSFYNRDQKTGLTAYQQVVANTNTGPRPGMAPKQLAKWICTPKGQGKIQQNAVIMVDERGLTPRLVIEVSYFNGNRSDSWQIVRYSWNGSTEKGMWFDEGTGLQGTFTGRYDYAANRVNGAIFFEGIKTELDGSESPFRFERSY